MNTTIIRLPRTPYGRVELVCAKAKGLDLAGVDWDAEGARTYADWKSRNNEINGRNNSNGSIPLSPDDAA